ncbi:MAG: bifunctional (p)ppGpp synthetase/guanosine-3',5'-bis(diphosphate) 3'-pyrophosphohydrolase [Rickettsiaceae bacterium]|nr:bifunctional (p)ppGpp synthetase/guanosine-3',5'-bis(diphosphate) 3'-pyrophosphohydrolase [Rickettsiaceae bacterium]
MEKNNSWITKYENCFYSERLITKLISLSEKTKNRINLLEIKKAIYYAKKYHGVQKRESGEPYYSHPLEVAYMISDYLFRTDIIITSILHDTIEDTDLTFEMIQTEFSPLVASQVADLSRIKVAGKKISSAEMVKSLWLQKKYDLLLIKLFDRLHNMQTISVKTPQKIHKIVEETISAFLVLAVYLNIPDAEKQIVHLCAKYINPKLLDEEHSRPFESDQNLLSLISQNDLNRK